MDAMQTDDLLQSHRGHAPLTAFSKSSLPLGFRPMERVLPLDHTAHRLARETDLAGLAHAEHGHQQSERR